MLVLRGRSAVVACIVVLGLGSALAQGPSPGPSGSGSSSALSFGAPAFSCYGSVSLDANGKLVALDGGEAGNWPQTATINECPTRSPTFSGSGVSVGSSMSMGMEEDKCIMFVILPQISDFMTAGSASGSSSGSGGMDIPISVGGGCYDPTADWAQRNGITCDENGIGWGLDGSFLYVCCTGDSCNDQSLLAANYDALNRYVTPDCGSEMARECVEPYADNYGCLKTGIVLPLPHQPMPDDCAPFLLPMLGCLDRQCAQGCNLDCLMPGGPSNPACSQYCETFEQVIPAPGCFINMIGNGVCDPLCLNEHALYDGGDCLDLPYTKVGISHMLIAHDLDNSGTLDMHEASLLPHLCNAIDSEMFAKFDVAGDDGLDAQELYLVVLTMFPNKDMNCVQFLSLEERSAVMPVYEQNTQSQWGEVSYAYSVPLWMFADANMDAIVDREEARMAFGLTPEEYDFLAGGRDAEASFEHVNDVFAAALAALKGDFWDHWDYDMDMAMKVWVKFADYSRDGAVSEGEALYIGIGAHLYTQLDVEMAGEITAESLTTLVRGVAVGPCNGYRVVDETDVDLIGQLPLLRPSTCKLALMPGWNYAREMEPDMMPLCNASNFEQRNAAPPAAALRGAAKHKKGLHKSNAELMGARRAVLERQAAPVEKKSAKKLQAKQHKPRASKHKHVERVSTPLRSRRSMSRAHTKLHVHAHAQRSAAHTAAKVRPALHTKAEHPRRKRAQLHKAGVEGMHERHSKASTRIVGGEDADPLEFPFVVAISMGLDDMFGSFGFGSGSASGSGPLMRRRLMSRTRTPDAAETATPEAKTVSNIVSGAYCTGSLIAPGWVLTAAHCVFGEEARVVQFDVVTIGIHDAVEINQTERGCMEQFEIEAVLVHPGYDTNTLVNDVALLKLSGESSYPPVELYDGGDLMFTDCKRLEPTAVGWGITDAYTDESPLVLQTTKLEPVSPWECADVWYHITGMDMVDPDTMMCMTGDFTDTCSGDSGGPLLAPHPDSKTGWVQIGITSWGSADCQGTIPAMYTRVSEVLQWILSVQTLGQFPAKAMHLTLDSVNIPPGAQVEVWKGLAEVVEDQMPSPKLLDSLDSKCDAGMTYSDQGEGGMLVTIKTTTPFDAMGFLCREAIGWDEPCMSWSLGGPGPLPPLAGMLPPGPLDDEECDMDCKKMLGVRAMLEAKGCGDNFMPGEERDPQMLKGMCEDPAMGGVEGCAYRPNPDGVGRVCVEETMCEVEGMTWERVTHMARMGKALTGGLGISAEKTHHHDFRTYVCIRDWDVEEQLACNVKPGEFGCFRFDEIHREFHWFGLNSELKILKPEVVMEAMLMERRMIAALPPVHEE